MARPTRGCVYQPTFRANGEKRKSSIWWIKYYVPGQTKPLYESSKSRSKDEAIAFLKGRMAATPDASRRRKTTCGELLDLVIADWRRQRNRTARAAAAKVEKHLRPYFGLVEADQVSSRDVEQFIDLQQRVLKNASINRLLAFLHRAFKLGFDRQPPLVTHVPKFPRLPEDEARQGMFNHESYKALCGLLPDYARLALVIAYHTGARKGEIVSIRRCDVDLEAARIIRPGTATKNKRPRYLPIYGDMAAEIRMALDQPEDGCPFLIRRTFRGRAAESVQSFYKAWDVARKLAGAPKGLFHDLRRTALTNMIEAGLSEKEAMEISGHRTRAVFDRYHIVTAKRLKQNAEKLEAYLDGKNSSAPPPGPTH